MQLNVLDNVMNNKGFLLINGRPVANLKELHNLIENLSEEDFSNHVNESKNDFYNWIKEAYNDKSLAEDLLQCSTKEAILFCLKSTIEEGEDLSIFKDSHEHIENDAEKDSSRLLTLLDPSFFENKKKMSKPSSGRSAKTTSIKPKNKKEKFNKAQIKKLFTGKPSYIISKLKGVHGIE